MLQNLDVDVKILTLLLMKKNTQSLSNISYTDKERGIEFVIVQKALNLFKVPQNLSDYNEV